MDFFGSSPALLTDFKFPVAAGSMSSMRLTNANGFFRKFLARALNILLFEADDWHRQAHVAIFQMLLDDVVSAAAIRFFFIACSRSVNH